MNSSSFPTSTGRIVGAGGGLYLLILSQGNEGYSIKKEKKRFVSLFIHLLKKQIMKKYSFLLFLFSFLMASTLLVAQEDSDPKAKAILEKVRKKYEGYSNMEAEFTLTMEVPGRSKETQKGKMQQKGDKYHVNLDDQEVICDGKSTWIYLKKNKEVQVNDASASSDANSL
ncbi:MAG: hypothetical protein RLZZ292_4080, partial [Bacteroidota bacterium]